MYSKPTKTWRKQHNIKISHELLRVRIEHALPGHDIAGQTDTYHLQHRFENEQYQVAEVRMRGVWWRFLHRREYVLRHGAWRDRTDVGKLERCGIGEERHPIPVKNSCWKGLTIGFVESSPALFGKYATKK